MVSDNPGDRLERAAVRSAMGRTVLLLHELPDGSSHLDWMIQPGPDHGGDTPLVSFRVALRIDSGEWGCFLGERIADHRAAYLDFEGEIAGGRGRVRRVAEGDLRIEAYGGSLFRAAGRLGRARGVFSGFRRDDGAWAFSFDPEPAPTADGDRGT
jgi:hypothetical protein